MRKIIEKALLKHCGRLTKSFYPEAILRDKEIIASNISEQDVIDFLDDCEYLQKIGEIRCPNCCRVLSYYDVEELDEDDDLDCPDCDYEFTFDKYCTYYRYNVLHNKVPQVEVPKKEENKCVEKNVDITEQVFEALKTLINFVNDNDCTKMNFDIEVPNGIIHTHFEFSATKKSENLGDD